MGSTREKLQSVLMLVNWAGISRDYFGKSRSWLHHKMSRTDVNGTGHPLDFTDEERERLKEALLDVGNRIIDAAEKL